MHALLGENGAGKSTLLEGTGGSTPAHQRTTSLIGAGRVSSRSTAESLAAGVAIIHQELHLVPEMSVAENLYLGHTPQGWRSGSLG